MSLDSDLLASLANSGYMVHEGAIMWFEAEPGVTSKGVLKRPFVFRCGPIETFRTGRTYEHNEFMTLNAGQHSRPTGEMLKTWTINTVLEDMNMPYSTFDDISPNMLSDLAWLSQTLRGGSPFRFKFGHEWIGGWEVDEVVTMRGLDSEERAGELHSRYIELTLTEYEGADLVGRLKGRHKYNLPLTVTLTERGGKVIVSGTGAWKPGDISLAGLSKHFYGSVSHWAFIAKANPTIRGFSANRSITMGLKASSRKSLKITIPAFTGKRPGPG